MQKLTFIILIMVALGCAKVNLQTSQPIKLDINMRVDVYQHVVKDIDDIESIVSGAKKEAKPKAGRRMNLFLQDAYAQDLSPEVEAAALRRKSRFSEIMDYEQKGILGENRLGLLEIRGAADNTLNQFIQDENNDRMVIYQGVAKKNGIAVAEVQKIYAQKLQGSAPQGTPIEVSAGGKYEWKVK